MARSFDLDPAKLWGNGKTPVPATVGAVSYYKVSNGAFYRYVTSATLAWVHQVVEFADGPLSVNGRLGAVVNGKVRYGPATRGVANSMQAPPLKLPVGVDKVVDIFVASQYASSAGASPLGAYPFKIVFNDEAVEVDPVLTGDHLVGYGDSIMSGGLSLAPSVFGFMNLLRMRGNLGRVTSVSYGTRRLVDDCATVNAYDAVKTAAFVASLLSLNPTRLLITIGSNDHSVIPAVSLTLFAACVGGLLDQIHAQAPSLPVVWLTPIRRGAEGTNSNGNTMAQFRTVIVDACAARAGWSKPPVAVDGLAMFADLTQLPDQTHPGTTGNVTYADYVEPYLMAA